MALKVAFESSEVGGIWGLVSSAAGTTELGAYLAPEAPTGTHTLTGTITVFWCGDLERNQLPKFVTLAEETLDPSGAVKGSILAFGPTREAGSTDNGGIGKYLEKPSKFFGFDAYRIRLDHGPETFILWTTLQGSARPLNELGENIGICVRRTYIERFYSTCRSSGLCHK